MSTCSCLSASALPGGSIPAGSVGLIAADHFQIAALLRDMTQHYAHYRSTARHFAQSYSSVHEPGHALRQLVSNASASAAAALTATSSKTLIADRRNPTRQRGETAFPR